MSLEPARNVRYVIDYPYLPISDNRAHRYAVSQVRVVRSGHGLTRFQRILKRSFDIGLASLGLVLVAPSIIVIGLVIRLTDSGPILFRQQRIGLGGRAFTLLKFRTMAVAASLMPDETGNQSIDDGALYELGMDPRVTPAGVFLRRYGLDELPQLWNVLKGDMSFVGPRPSLPQEMAMYENWQLARFDVRPGITGLWQITGRNDLSFDDYIHVDMFYIENWSFLYDVYILLKTLFRLLSSAEVY
jgi:lipopolysaccharide/colanic/teichoic acid biosynthesis glycosyltransferase